VCLVFEMRRGKWNGWKELAGICEFGETDLEVSSGQGVVRSGWWRETQERRTGALLIASENHIL